MCAEKDGLWAVLLWLSILAGGGARAWPRSRARHWATYGRNYYTRHDHEDLDSGVAQALMQAVADQSRRLASGANSAGARVRCGR